MAVPLKALGINSKDENEMMGLGWLHELPDIRDYSVETEAVSMILKPLKLSKISPSTLPAAVDMKNMFSPIENQQSIGSCTAHAGVGLVEYFERKAFGTHIDASRLFLYKVTRNLLQVAGDTGAYLRTTMAAMTLFGVPPEKYWPYDIKKFDIEPTAFLYSFAEDFEAINYFRLDPPGTSPSDLLARIKTYIAAGLPLMFGFTVYDSISQAATTGKIPFPCAKERVLGGHAIDAVGYSDQMRIKNTVCGLETTGAFLIRNSWGTGWGDKGYGWLPYDYVLKGLAGDWWGILKAGWIDTGEFGLK